MLLSSFSKTTNMTEKEVTVTVGLRGAQIVHGSYTHFVKSEGTGILQGVVIDKKPEYAKCSKVVRLKEQFIEEAIANPPKSKNSSKLERIWNRIPINKRIEIHAKDLIHSLYPDHVGFSIDILG